MTKRRGVGTFRATEKMKDYVNDVLESGRISYGPYCRQYEREFSRRHGCKFGVVSNSGTDALRTALAALKEHDGWRNGDEVIVPATTFVATVNVVLQNGLKPVLADVDPVYYTVDPDRVEAVVTDRTRCIIPVHVFGQPADMRAITDISQRYGLRVIEDSCEAMFVHDNETMVGAWGDIACFSSYVAHLLTTGVGGIATTNRPEFHDLMRSYVNHGRNGIYTNVDDDEGKQGEALRQVVTRRFRFERVGWSARMTELEAALACAQLDDVVGEENWVHWMLRRRRENVATFVGHAAELGVSEWLQLPQTREGATHAWMMLPLVLRDPGEDTGRKTRLTQYLEEAGVETREMLPLTNQPVYDDLFDEDDYPVARWINRGGFYIGCHQNLTTEDMAYAAERLAEWRRREGADQATIAVS